MLTKKLVNIMGQDMYSRAYSVEEIRDIITGIEIYEGSIRIAEKNVKEAGLWDMINIKQRDATCLDFPDKSFDSVVNYLGLEDIHMTRGKSG